jgi:hypothetical protein
LKSRRAWRILTCIAALLCVAPCALAQEVDDSTRNAARSLASQGKDAFDGKDYARAVDLLRRAYALVPAPTIALYEGQSLIQLGRLVEAEEAFMRAMRTPLDAHSPEQFRKAKRDAEQELGALRPRIPKVTIVVTGPGAGAPNLAVALDGKAVKNAVLGVEMPIDPGNHVLTTGAGGERREASFSIAEQEHKKVEIEALAVTDEAAPVAPPPAPPRRDSPSRDVAPAQPAASWQKPAAFVLGGVGVAGLATGIVTGLMAASEHASAEKECTNRVCTEGTAGAEALESFRTLRTVSTIGYVVGGVGLAGGAVLFLLAPSTPPATAASRRRAGVARSPELRVWVGVQSAGLQGAF